DHFFCCVALAFIPKSWITVMVIYFMGLSGVELDSYGLASPSTSSRNLFHTARLFSVGVGYLSILSYYWKPLPLLIIGIPGFFAGNGGKRSQ
ncbi:Uncharacterized protein FKW44_004974, partial [Caligus rogercresseyi]